MRLERFFLASPRHSSPLWLPWSDGVYGEDMGPGTPERPWFVLVRRHRYTIQARPVDLAEPGQAPEGHSITFGALQVN